MAAYAALVSVMHIIDQIQLHPSPPISLDQKQVESLTKKVTFLQDFLENYSHGGNQEAYDLESRIADASYAAEDIIESHIVNQILAHSTSHGETLTSFDFYQSLEEVIENMDLIMQEVMEKIKGKGVKEQLLRHSTVPDGPSIPPTSTMENTMVGFDDVLIDQIIPIVGMGGIGKTTLAQNVYVNPLIVYHFDICAWVTISQDYNVFELLVSSNKHESRENVREMSEEELGEKLYKSLWGRKYLIVMDDMWSIEAWDKLKFFLPENNNGSRIMITTRLSKLAFHLVGSHGFEMKFLDDNKSWILFSKMVFGEEGYPPELEEIGKKIAKGCKGLPLSIAVIGGLLAKSERTRQYWEYIAENLNQIVNMKDEGRCLKILSMSYINLPVYLKPCFLYMGVFFEDKKIHVSTLIKLLVAEGFLKPISGKSLEVVAEEYFNDLIDRNLILVHRRGFSGKIKFCKMHDLVKDLCLREAQKEKFLCIPREHSPNVLQSINTQRRIVVNSCTANDEYHHELLYSLQSTSVVRSLICGFQKSLRPHTCRLLRVLEAYDMNFYTGKSRKDECSTKDIFQLVNLRYLVFTVESNLNPKFLFSIYLFWNLQTLIINDIEVAVAPSEIWMMPQLRHVMFDGLYLPDPPSVEEDKLVFVLRNLQTLLKIRNFKCGEDVVNRIPNIKKLKVLYEEYSDKESRIYCLNNLGCLHKLESLSIDFRKMPNGNYSPRNLTFPHSLRKLTLSGSCLDWEEMSSKVGSLLLLQVLNLYDHACKGPEWQPVEGQFCSLKLLRIIWCKDLEYWTADNTNFPLLEHLVLINLDKLKEVPSGIGDIPTLRSIVLKYSSISSIISVKDIVDEQEEYGNVDLQVQVLVPQKDEILESLESDNFQVRDLS